MKVRRLSIILLLCIFATGCATVSGKKPTWLTKKMNSPDVLEGLGYAALSADKKAARDAAYNDAIQKLTLAGEIEVKGYLESKLYSSRDFPGNEKGEVLLDSVNKSIFNTILGKKYFEEYYDGSAREYWVYVYLPVSSVKRITAEEGIKSVDEEARKTTATQQMKKDFSDIKKELEADLEKYRNKENEDSKKLEDIVPQ